MPPSRDQTGVPGLVRFAHFHSSTMPGSASLMVLRTLLSTLPRQSPSSLILSSMSFEADVLVTIAISVAVRTVAEAGFRRGSGQLLDADEVPGRVAKRTVAHAVRLIDRLLDDLGTPGLQLLERAVHILRRQEDPAVCALRHHLGDGALLVLGDPGVDRRRC